MFWFFSSLFRERFFDFLLKIKACQSHLSFFIDPLFSHRIYRDFLIPNLTEGQPIYHFQSYLAYKSLSQVHVRDGGVVLQFNDHVADYITPMGLLQKRLDSVGNVFCHDLAQFLPKYYEYFENKDPSIDNKEDMDKISLENDPFTSLNSNSGLLLDEIDKIFLGTQKEILLITVYQENIIGDDRLHMLVFNRNLINLLTLEENFKGIFENDLVEQLLQMFKDYSFDHYMEEFVNFLKHFPLREMEQKLNPNSDKYTRELNTVFGLIKVSFCLKNFLVEINGNKYRLICSIVENEDRNLLMKLLENKSIKDDEVEKKTKTDKDWSQLFQIYYRNDK